ncbi:hypothetical protein Tco_0441769 [Tanacetum coccineum]
MVVLESCLKHNMVAYLEKTKGNAQFHEIMDFSIHKLDFYCSLESSIRRDLLFNDDNEIECLIVANIYENLPLMGNLEAKKKFLMYPRFVQVFLNNQLQNIPAPLDNLLIPVLSKKVFTNMTRRGLHFSRHVTPLFPTMLVPAAVKEGEGGHTSDRAEGSLNLDELFVLCTNLSNRVLALETSKDAQAIEILKLKTRIQRKKKRRERKKDRKLGEEGRKNSKPGPTLDDSAFVNLDDDGMDYMDIEEAMNEGRQSKETEELNMTHDIEVLEKEGSNEEQVNVAGNIRVSIVVPEVSTVNISTASRPEVSTATPMTPPTTISVFDNEDITLAETLVKMKDDKAKLKGVAIKEVKEFDRPARSVLTLKPLPKIDPKDKGKGVLKEEPEPAKKLKKSDLDAAQLAMDKEYTRQVNAEFSKEDLAEQRVKARKQTHVDSDASKKKTGSLRMKRMSNMKKTDFNLEEEEYLKTFLKIVLDEEGIRASTTGSLDLMEALDGLKPFLRCCDFYEICGVHTLILEDGTEIHMLAERKYPLTKETLEKMMSLKLVVGFASDSAYDLLRFI